MTMFTNRTLAVAAAAGAMAAATPALAQTSKIATINAVEAIFGARALPTAMQQIDAKYAAQLKTATDRQAAVAARVKPLYDQLDTNKDGNLDAAEQQAAVQAQKPQVKQIQDIENAEQTAINTTLRPYQLARIYLFDQLNQRYSASVDGQVRTKAIGLVIPANGVIRSAPGTDITAAVKAEVDKPLAIDPPAGWQPTQESVSLLEAYLRAVQEAAQQRAAQQAQQQPAGTPAPAGTTPPARPATPARDRNGDPINK